MRMSRVAGQEVELLAQLRELIVVLPSPPSPTSWITAPPPPHSHRVEPEGSSSHVLLSSTTRRHRGSKRSRRDDKEEQAGCEEPADAQLPRRPTQTRMTKKKKQRRQSSTAQLVTSVPDYDGYQWRKYGQKQIEGAMYPRSYYRCTRSAEQGCHAKRTVQRNDDDAIINDSSSPKYTVVYMAEHTCAANDSTEAPPVILETTAAAATVPPSTKQRSSSEDVYDDSSPTVTATATATGTTESPAISDVTWSSSPSSDHVRDSWAPIMPDANASSSWLLHEIEDFMTGPIRSPVHIAADNWTMMDLLPAIATNNHFPAAFSF